MLVNMSYLVKGIDSCLFPKELSPSGASMASLAACLLYCKNPTAQVLLEIQLSGFHCLTSVEGVSTVVQKVN